MRRISHDLPGVTQRINRLTEQLGMDIEDTQELWRDDKGRTFFQRHTSEVRPTVGQLVAAMAKSTEIFEDIAKKLRDPDKP